MFRAQHSSVVPELSPEALQHVVGGGGSGSKPRVFTPLDAVTYTTELGRGSSLDQLAPTMEQVQAQQQRQAQAQAQFRALVAANPAMVQLGAAPKHHEHLAL